MRPDILNKIYRKRDPDSTKYDFGLLLVIGGSEFYSGSPALSGMAAFRTGADMVRIIAPKRAADIVASFSPDLAAYPLQGDYLTEKHLPTLISMTKSAKSVAKGNAAVVIGGGMGRSEQTQQAILKYLSQLSLPAVIDADAIYAVAQDRKVLEGKPFLVTPHCYEFLVLTEQQICDIKCEKRADLVSKAAQDLDTTILLKGRVDIVSDGQKVAQNKTGCALMTKGGMGDTLAGVGGALLARGVKVFDAGCAAAFINGKAGEKAAQQLGESVVATDLIGSIPQIVSGV